MKKKIAVVGDILVDEYLNGEVTRISPEAPIPIVKTDGEITYILGGCGNVANNIIALGCQVVVFSVCGNDYNGKKLIDILHDRKIEFDVKFCLQSCKTIVKRRIVGNGQQIVRIDFNDRLDLLETDRDTIIKTFKNRIDEFDIVVISDYDKGVCNRKVCESVIGFCKDKNIPVIVDPKGTSWDKYKGAYLITPNLKEISDYSGTKFKNEDEYVLKHAKSIYYELGIENLLITRSEQGMTLFTDSDIINYKSQAKEVFDVSGAGDTVVAAISVWLHEHLGDLENAVKFSNTAAGIVVGKAGTATVTRDEIAEENSKSLSSYAPVFDVNELHLAIELINKWKEQGLRIVTTNGCFDILHRGHAFLMNEAKKYGDKLVVCINSDASVRRLKGFTRPVNNHNDRAYLISALKNVDAVVIFDELVQGTSKTDVPFTALKVIKPYMHVKGGDYTIDTVPEAKYAEHFVAVKFIDGYSTTEIMNIEEVEEDK